MHIRSVIPLSALTAALLGCQTDPTWVSDDALLEDHSRPMLGDDLGEDETEVASSMPPDGYMTVTVGAKTYHAEIYGDMVVAEGDMVLGTVESLSVDADGVPLPPSAGRALKTYRWPDATIPYVIEDNVTTAVEQLIQDAIVEWEDNTLIEFVERTDEDDYVVFDSGDYQDQCSDGADNDGDGDIDAADSNCQRGYLSEDYSCSSFIGRAQGAQIIQAEGCSAGGLVHEIGHAVGLHHEQSRVDRDEWVEIVEDNIDPDKFYNFETYTERGRDGIDIGPFDFGSIMMYSEKSFAIDQDNNGSIDESEYSILPRDTDDRQALFSQMGQRSGLSDGDIYGVHRMYTDAWYLSRGGIYFWEPLHIGSDQLSDTIVGDFDGDGADDTLTADGDSWTIRYLSNDTSDEINYGFVADDLHAGDFDGDGADEVFMTWFSTWYYYDVEDGTWHHLTTPSIDADEVLPGDFDGDGVTDMLHCDGSYWTIYWGGVDEDVHVYFPLITDEVLIGDFDADGSDEIFFSWYGYWYTRDVVDERWNWLTTSDINFSDLLAANVSSDSGDEIVYLDGSSLSYWSAETDELTEAWATEVTADTVMVGNFDGTGREDLLSVLPQLVE